MFQRFVRRASVHDRCTAAAAAQYLFGSCDSLQLGGADELLRGAVTPQRPSPAVRCHFDAALGAGLRVLLNLGDAWQYRVGAMKVGDRDPTYVRCR